MNFSPVTAVLLVPLLAAAVLAVLPGYRGPARLNMLASLVTLGFAVQLFWSRPTAGDYLFIDDLNVVFIVLIVLVSFGQYGHAMECGTPH